MLTLWLLSFCVSAFAIFNPYPKVTDVVDEGDAADRLLLTPYIESGQIKLARKLALVPPLRGNSISYSGFFTVRPECQSNLFAWIFPAESNNEDAPVVIWLQGGPGASSLFGLFSELGPYMLTPDNLLIERKYRWTRAATCIFIDNPVGVGYSYTLADDCYARNQTEVGSDLLKAVKQILKMFPEYRKNPFFVTGESYGGKYTTVLSHAIHHDNDPINKINLQGLTIGNGFVDPINQLDYSDYLYQISLLDEHESATMKECESSCKHLIQTEKWNEAYFCFNKLINGDLGTKLTYFKNFTGFDYYMNLLYSKNQPVGDLTKFITKNKIRKSIHVGDATWHNGELVERYLQEDIPKSVRPWLEELLEHYRVLIYSGQLDIIVAHPLMKNYVRNLNWRGAIAFQNATRNVWYVDSEIAGYAKAAGNLTVVLVRNAGHMVPMDQSKWAFDLISRFLQNKPFFLTTN